MCFISETALNSPLCSFCICVVASPRTNLGPCNHKFCISCLETFKISLSRTSNLVSKLDNSNNIRCPLCVSKEDQDSLISPTEPDFETEKAIAAINVISCPFAKFGTGCKASGMDIVSLAQHISSSSKPPCHVFDKFSTALSVCCANCESWLPHVHGPVHVNSSECTTACSKCQRKIRIDRKAAHESLYCPSLSTETPAKTQPAIVRLKEWEKQLVDKKKYPSNSAACLESAEAKKMSYLSSLTVTNGSVSASRGETFIKPDVASLKEILNLLATGLSILEEQGKPGSIEIYVLMVSTLLISLFTV